MAHILIVDDDELISECAADALLAAGHACGWVTSGERALELLERRRPDLILLDQDMPDMTGKTLLRQLRCSEKFYDLPVLMFTALAGRMDEEQAIYAGADGYIRKPFQPDGLCRTVARFLAEREHHARHESLKVKLAKSAGTWREPENALRRAV